MVQEWPRGPFPRQVPFQPQCYPPAAHRHPFIAAESPGPNLISRQDYHPHLQYQPECSEDVRLQDAHDHDNRRRQPPMQIDEALRLHCGIAAKQYFVAAITEEGVPMTFFSPGQEMNDQAIRQFFDVSKYHQVMRRIDSGLDPILGDKNAQQLPTYARHDALVKMQSADRRRISTFDEWDAPVRQVRKRPRARASVAEDEGPPMTVSSRRGIKVGDSEAVWSFYEQRFKNYQQTACKLIAKAWVKAVEPKKQSTHPYTGSDEKAPDWWPKPWGPTKDDKVRHKEPDHLYKRERVHLLAHILRLVVESNAKQHPNIQKLGLNVKKLEESTNEALSAFFLDNETNAKKRPFLNEIFKMARQERFKNAYDSTEVYVMAEDRLPEANGSDNDEGSLGRTEDDLDAQRPRSAATHCVFQDSTNASATGRHLSSAEGTFLGDLPVRSTAFPPPMMPTELGPQQTSFVESGDMSVSEQTPANANTDTISLGLCSAANESSRRPSIYSEYASPVAGNMYNQPWHQGSAGSNSSSMYSFSTQQTAPSQSSFVTQSMQMGSGQPFLSPTYDNSARSGFEAGGHALFRSTDLSSTPVNQTPGFFVQNAERENLRVVH